MKLGKEDLQSGNSGTPDQINPKQVVDQELNPDPSSSQDGIKEIIRMVRETVQEFNGLTNELKSNPEVAQMIAQQNQSNEPVNQAEEQNGGGRELNPDNAFQMFSSGIESLEDQLGSDATLEEAGEFLRNNETIVKAQIKRMM